MGWLIVASVLLVPALVLLLPAARAAPPGDRIGRARRVALLLAAVPGGPIVAFWALGHTADGYNPAGAPWLIAVVPALLLLALPALRGWRPPHLPATLLIVAAAMVPACLWESAAHSRQFTQCLGCYGPSRAPSDWVKEMLEDGAADERAYPEGWLEGSPLVVRYRRPARLLNGSFRTEEARALRSRHTRFTALYDVDRSPAALWYSGGRIADAVRRVEYRPL